MHRMAVPALLALLLPGVAAQGLLRGTEELPELPASGPEQYGIGYSGAKDHDYLQIQAGWFTYDNLTDDVVWTLKLEDGTGYTTARDDYSIYCSAEGNITEGDATKGRLDMSWSRPAGGKAGSYVSFTYASENINGVGRTTTDRVNHSFVGRFGTPTYFEFRMARPALLHFGPVITDFEGLCAETYEPGPGNVLGPVTVRTNQNSARSESEAVYSFVDLRRVAGPNGALDPIEQAERETTTPSSVVDGPADIPPKTPGLPFVVVLAALAIVAPMAAWRRKPGA